MEVKKSLSLLVLLTLFLGACAADEQGTAISRNNSLRCTSLEISGRYILQWSDGSITFENQPNDEALVKNVLSKSRGKVVYAEPDYLIKPYQDIEITPSAPPTETWGQEEIKLTEAWNLGAKGQGIIVAVVDQGVDIEHPQLINQLAINNAELNGTLYVDDDNNGFTDDMFGWNFWENSPLNNDEGGHGTHVSGTIAADSASGSVVGVAPQAKILPLDFMSRSGGTTEAAISALMYAHKMGAKIVNASWGGSSCSNSLKVTLENLSNQNMLIIVAAGNSGANLELDPEFPAAFEIANQITVAALDPSGLMATFSNFGKPTHLLAPGAHIFSTVPEHISSSGTYWMSGTSMAAPFVAGIAALVWSAKPTATAAQVKAAILGSLVNLPANQIPRGKIRAQAAVQAIQSLP